MFLKAAESYGVTKTDMFQTVDLFESKTTSRTHLYYHNYLVKCFAELLQYKRGSEAALSGGESLSRPCIWCGLYSFEIVACL